MAWVLVLTLILYFLYFCTWILPSVLQTQWKQQKHVFQERKKEMVYRKFSWWISEFILKVISMSYFTDESNTRRCFILTTSIQSLMPAAPSRGVECWSASQTKPSKGLLARGAVLPAHTAAEGSMFFMTSIAVFWASVQEIFMLQLRIKNLWPRLSLPVFFTVPKHTICPAIINKFLLFLYFIW